MGVELCIEMPVMTFSPFGNTKLFGNKRPRQGKKAAEICETFGMDPSGIEELDDENAYFILICMLFLYSSRYWLTSSK